MVLTERPTMGSSVSTVLYCTTYVLNNLATAYTPMKCFVIGMRVVGIMVYLDNSDALYYSTYTYCGRRLWRLCIILLNTELARRLIFTVSRTHSCCYI